MQVGNIMTINIKKKSVHLKNGGEMCDIDVAVKATKNELINQMKCVFFQMEILHLENVRDAIYHRKFQM